MCLTLLILVATSYGSALGFCSLQHSYMYLAVDDLTHWSNDSRGSGKDGRLGLMFRSMNEICCFRCTQGFQDFVFVQRQIIGISTELVGGRIRIRDGWSSFLVSF